MSTRTWDPALLDGLRAVGDAPADAVVASYFADRGLDDPGALMAHLVRHDALPPEAQDPAVGAWLAAPTPATSPPWIDHDQLERARGVFERHGPHVFAALYAASLPTCYAGWEGVHVLHLTARLATDAKRRITETARFHLDVMARDGLRDGGAGVRTTQHVRLMHAAVRWLVQHDPRVVQGAAPADVPHYDPAWGVPVCQDDLLNTLLTFTQVVFEVLDRCGVDVPEADRAAYLHAFCVVGWHLGIEPGLLPLDLHDASTLLEHMRRRRFGHSVAGAEMTAALLDVGQAGLPRLLRGLPVSTIRYYVGDATANLLDVPPSDWSRHLFGPLRRVSRAVGAETAHSRLVGALSRRLGLGLLDVAVTTQRGGSRPPFEMPSHLASSWGVGRS